ncbi:MAG TPA: DNA polymerase/3'-5' exonuclease PolX [Bacteroidota bacterium]|nr:DNA polymerase/3'-5' exonuclease PolX [Bacteroidota bacterium]
MEKAKVAQILDEIGTLLELKGENPFKCRAYHNAARSIEGVTTDLESLVRSGDLRSVKGIGEAIAEKVSELVLSGRSPYHEELKSSLPEGLLKILAIQGVGPKKVKLLYEKLGISSVEELEKACKEGKLAGVEGFGSKTEENILAGIAALRKHSSKFLFSVAEKAAAGIFESVRLRPGVIRAEIAGSVRRRKETIGDIDIVLSAKPAAVAAIMKAFTTHPDVERITGEGETKSSVVLASGINCDLRVVNDAEFPFALNYFTGSKDHNVRLRTLAKGFGLSLNEYGFSRIGAEEKRGKAKKAVICKNEEDIYKALRLQYVPPELREDFGEIEAAQRSALPILVTDEEIRGTFHCHSRYSDGLNTIEEMAEGARALGWEYLGIADHSRVAAYANGLSPDRVKKQQKEIEALNLKWTNFRIFSGTEVDILANGALDFNDKVLASFDYVVASVHSSFKMTEADMTKRILKALKNKYVTMLGHPTGRLLLQREAYPLNQQTIIEAAADYGKCIEINAHPSRLDLDWRMCKYAKEKGVKIVINPDAHVVDGLKDVRYGVGIARKGWLEKNDLLNTMRLHQVQKFFAGLRR